jgi:GntR family transcriptional repressor for pyruvate dehydrogenase complex
MDIQPIAKNSLVSHVVDRVRGLIEQGNLQPGDRLPTESVLVERLGVSRGALREAVRQLATLGLLTVEHGRGMFVAGGDDLSRCAQLFRSAMAVSPKDSLQFAEFRRIIECYAARRAAERATPADVAELERFLDLKDEGGLSAEGVHWDWLFHRKLAELAGNQVLLNVMVVLQEMVVAGIAHTTRAPDADEVRRSHQLHQAILDAVRAGDANAAEKAMNAHMDALVKTLKRLGDKPKRRARGLAGTRVRALPV